MTENELLLSNAGRQSVSQPATPTVISRRVFRETFATYNILYSSHGRNFFAVYLLYFPWYLSTFHTGRIFATPPLVVLLIFVGQFNLILHTSFIKSCCKRLVIEVIYSCYVNVDGLCPKLFEKWPLSPWTSLVISISILPLVMITWKENFDFFKLPLNTYSMNRVNFPNQ